MFSVIFQITLPLPPPPTLPPFHPLTSLCAFRYKDMHDIRRFFVNSVQRSHTVILEVVRLLHEEFQKRLGNQEIITDSDALLSHFSADDLRKQFVVVRSEEEMVETMRKSLELNENPFDIIISPFGCDSKSLPPHVVKLLGVEEEEDTILPKRMAPKRVSNFNSPATTPTAPPTPTSISEPWPCCRPSAFNLHMHS
jgi:hypothetical protein